MRKPIDRIDVTGEYVARPSDFIVWEGPSEYDCAPIVAIATGIDRASRNTKTGEMVQVWILRADVSPVAALKSGADVSICGGCTHRPFIGGDCYVDVPKAPRGIFAKYSADGYRRLEPARGNLALRMSGRNVRIGAYGDPAAVPVHVWNELLKGLEGRTTGYTHGWDGRAVDGLERWAMASTDTPAELERARALGYRSFRVRTASEPLSSREIACPASEEAGKKTNCDSCKACGGLNAKARVDVAIIAHGVKSRAKAKRAAIAIAA
jgi:hypothetical protein